MHKRASQEKRTTYKLTTLTGFVAFLREIFLGNKISVLPEPPLKNHSASALYLRRRFENPILTNYVSSELQPCFYMKVSKDSWRIPETKHLNYSIFSFKNWLPQPCKKSSCLYGSYRNCWGHCWNRRFLYKIDIVDRSMIDELAQLGMRN